MASTYTNDLRLELIATGEAAATWGDKTNTNLTNIAAAFGYATQDCFGANADSTTTVADGAADPARAMYFKVTSSATLTATRILTIAPNTISRVMWIENATTGGQSIAISQGSGANVTIATGKTVVVYLDGAGSGAAVVDAMAGVDPGVTDTLAEVLAAGNTTTTDQKIQFRDSAIYINSSADGQLDLVADTEIQIAATTVDLNGNLDVSGTVVAGGVVTANAGVVVDNITIDGTTLTSTGDFNVDAVGDIAFDADGGDWRFKDAGTTIATYSNVGGSWYITSNSEDGDIVFQGNDGGSTVAMMSLDASEAGAATFNAGVTSGAHLINASSSAFGGSSVQGFNTDFLVDTGQGYARHNSYHTGGSNHQFLVNEAGSTTNAVALSIAKDKSATFAADVTLGDGATLKIDDQDSISFGSFALGSSGTLMQGGTSTDFLTYVGGKKRQTIASNGDISFFEDTGTTAKLHWSASAEALGIGTSSLVTNATLSVAQGGVFVDGGASGGASQVILSTGASSGSNFGQISNTGTRWALGYGSTPQTIGTEVLTWNSSGNVGIGTAGYGTYHSDNRVISLGSGSTIRASSSGAPYITITSNAYHDSSGWKYVQTHPATNYEQYNGIHTFSYAASGSSGNSVSFSEAMRISDGSLLVGKTNDTQANAGHVIFGSGAAYSTRNGFTWLHNRLSTHGDIIKLQKDGADIGSLGVSEFNGLQLGSTSGTGFRLDTSDIMPMKSGSVLDDAVNLGYPTVRFKNLYLSSGVVFGATGGAVTSKTLDDYEEGTWTPVLRGSSTAGTPSVGTLYGSYVKIGKLVTLTLRVTNLTLSGGSGAIQITGIPFTATTAGSNYGSAAFSMTNNINFDGDKNQNWYMGSSYMLGLESQGGGGWADLAVTNASSIYIHQTITYEEA